MPLFIFGYYGRCLHALLKKALPFRRLCGLSRFWKSQVRSYRYLCLFNKICGPFAKEPHSMTIIRRRNGFYACIVTSFARRCCASHNKKRSTNKIVLRQKTWMHCGQTQTRNNCRSLCSVQSFPYPRFPDLLTNKLYSHPAALSIAAFEQKFYASRQKLFRQYRGSFGNRSSSWARFSKPLWAAWAHFWPLKSANEGRTPVVGFRH